MPTFRERPDLINRKGRPKNGQTLTDILEKHGSKKDVKNGDEYIARKEGLAQKLWALALGGDVAASTSGDVNGVQDSSSERCVLCLGAHLLIPSIPE